MRLPPIPIKRQPAAFLHFFKNKETRLAGASTSGTRAQSGVEAAACRFSSFLQEQRNAPGRRVYLRNNPEEKNEPGKTRLP